MGIGKGCEDLVCHLVLMPSYELFEFIIPSARVFAQCECTALSWDIGESGFDHDNFGSIGMGVQCECDGCELILRMIGEGIGFAGVPLIGKGSWGIEFGEASLASVLTPDEQKGFTGFKVAFYSLREP
jgi:hypothetical protein